MFLVRLTYTAPIDTVDALIPAHRTFLKEMYRADTFLLSGRTEPRDGGVILASASSREALQLVLARDPFQAVAVYTIIEFVPSMAAPLLSRWLRPNNSFNAKPLRGSD